MLPYMVGDFKGLTKGKSPISYNSLCGMLMYFIGCYVYTGTQGNHE